MSAVQCVRSCRYDSGSSVNVINHQNGIKCNLGDFDRGMIVGARGAGLSISVTVDLLRFLHKTVSRVYPEWCEKQRTSSEQQFCGQKCFVGERCQQRMARQKRQITTLHNCGEQKSISERITRRTLRRMGYNSRRPRRVSLLPANNRKLRLQWAPKQGQFTGKR